MASHNDVIGPLFVSGKLEEAATRQLQERLPAYLAHVLAQEGHAAIAGIKSWGITNDFDRWPEQALPALIVTCEGTDGKPSKQGSGDYVAAWSLGVIIEIGAANEKAARRYAELYSAAIRGVIMQRRSLGTEGLLVTAWEGEAKTVLEASERRSRFAIANAFSVDADEVVNVLAGPGEIAPPWPENWPEITEVDVEVNQ